MNYQDRLRAQLVKYKFRALEVLDGPKPHVLPADKLRLNILPAYRERFWAEFDRAAGREGSALTLAADFASLGSPQAFTFNLFYPLVADRSWAETFVETFLGTRAAPIALAFEYGGERTSFAIRLDDGGRLSVDARLGELTFGVLQEKPNLVFPRGNLSLVQRVPAGARVLHLEELCERIKPLLRGRDEALKAHYRQLATKYLVQDF
jgi:hypothetical protein